MSQTPRNTRYNLRHKINIVPLFSWLENVYSYASISYRYWCIIKCTIFIAVYILYYFFGPNKP